MALKPHPIRFSEGEWEAIKAEAQHAGLTASQLVRSSALSRAAFNYARRGGTGADTLAALFDAADEMVRKFPE